MKQVLETLVRTDNNEAVFLTLKEGGVWKVARAEPLE